MDSNLYRTDCIPSELTPGWLLVRHNDDALSKVLPRLHIQDRLPRVLKTSPNVVLLVPDFAARDALWHRSEELLPVLRPERGEDVAVQGDLATDEHLEVLDPVRLLRIVGGDVAANLDKR